MIRKLWFALGASVLALVLLPAGASATGSSEEGESGGNCSSSGALIAANCTNISGPQTQVGGGLVNEQNQNNSQQNGDNSGTSNANTNAVAVGNSQPSNDYEGESESSGSGGNCSQHGAIVAANCTNYSGGQYQVGGGLVNQQNQNNSQQNGDNSNTSNANTNAVAVGNSHSPDNYEGNSESSGSGGNCSQKATLIAANCSNISKGQEQVGGGGTDMYEGNFVQPGGGSLVNQQNQNNSQQNGDNSGTHNYNANVIAVGGHSSNDNVTSNGAESWNGNSKSESSGSGGNCSQFLTAVSANCTNYSGGQTQSNGDGIRATSLATIGGGGSLANQQNQNNNQQNGDNSGTSNQNANVIALGGHGNSVSNGNGSPNNAWEESSGSGGNCSQTLTAFALNCTNYSGGQTQSSGGGRGGGVIIIDSIGGGGSLVNQQNQNNNQQNGDNSGTSNQNANVIAFGSGPRNGGNGSPNNGWEESSGSGGNCSQFLTAVSANCTNISKGQSQSNGGGGFMGPEPFVAVPGGGGGSLVNQQNQNNNQQNGDNSGTSNQNANVIAFGGPSRENGDNAKEGNSRWSENGYREESERSGGGGNCTQAFALFAANCTNWSEGQTQSNGGREFLWTEDANSSEAAFISPGGGSLANQQNQNNNQQNGDNSGTHNYEANVIIVPGRRYTPAPV